MNRNLKVLLKRGKTVYGPWCTIPSAQVINIIATTGVDFVIIDMEHGPHNIETVADMVVAAEVAGSSTLVRVAKNDEALILSVLDIGADGVIVPHIESKDDAERAISYTKYYPLGTRGFSPFTRAGGYSLHNTKEHAARQNSETVLMLLLEGRSGIESLHDILSITDIENKVDGVYIGAYDLSQALGFPGQVDHPGVIETMKDSIRMIKEKGLAAGGYVAKNEQDALWMQKMGMQFITLLPDNTVLFHAFENLYHNFKRG